MAVAEEPQAFAHALAASIAESIVAVILHGSVVTGEYIPAVSDVDVLLITEAGLSEPQVGRMERAVRSAHSALGVWFDVRVVTRDAAAFPSPEPPMEAYFALHPGMVIDTMEIAAHQLAEPDLAVEFSICRTNGMSLIGPPPDALIGEVPPQWITNIGLDVLRRWQSIPFDSELSQFMVQTACRIWLFGLEGRHGGKGEALRWALARNSALPGVSEALQLRERGAATDTPISEAAVRAVLDHVIRTVAARAEQPLTEAG